MIIRTATDALDYKNEAISLWRYLKPLIGSDPVIPDRVDWQEDLIGMREATPILWSPDLMKVALAGVRQLLEQNINPPSACLPAEGHWHMCPEPIVSVVYEGSLHPIDSVLIKPIYRFKSGRKAIKVEAFSSTYNQSVKPAMIASFDWGMDLSLDEAVKEISKCHPTDATWASEVKAICFWIMSAEIFLAQPVFAVDHGHIERHTRKRIEKAGEIKPEVHVVRLRKFLNQEPNTKAEAKEVQWTCRWMVRGFWRNQFYPSKGRHEPIWIMPYVKGPEDKPFREPLPSIAVVVR